MKDQQPRPVWDIAPLTDRFAMPPEPVRDVAFGDGQRFTIGDTGTVSIEVFPAAAVTRVRTEDEQIEMHRSPTPRRTKNGVVFERPGADTFLLIQQDGTVAFMRKPVVPLETAETPADAWQEPDAGKTVSSPPAAVVASPDGAETASETSLASVAGATEQEKQERVTIRGRVGKAPRFRTTQKGRLVAQFQLAERDENDLTTWHNIVAFDQRAEKVQADVRSGMPLEVIGYVHEEEREKQDGSKRIDRKIYAVVVKSKV